MFEANNKGLAYLAYLLVIQHFKEACHLRDNSTVVLLYIYILT